MAAIQMQAVSKRFGKTEVIRGVDLDIHDGEFIVFVGPSGCGKSTLLRLIAGLEDLSCGHIAFDGEAVDELAPAERGIAMVFQSYALYPHMTVYDNLAFGLKLGRTQRVELDRRVREAAGILQIEHLLERKPKELSGGQRQRVAIGRAIVRSPRVFLFDEPLSNLDAALRVQMRIELAKLHRDLGTTMIYVTHDQVEAMTLASRIVVLNKGRVEQVGTPMELYRKPCNRFVAGFIGSPKMNFIEAKVATRDADQLELALADDSRIQTTLPDSASLQIGDAVVLGLRPEHLPLTDLATSVLRGTVITVEHLGSEAYVYVDGPGDEPLVVKTDGQIKVAVGDEIAIGVPAEACYLFDREGRALARPDTGHHSG